jgi:hypothetical protein
MNQPTIETIQVQLLAIKHMMKMIGETLTTTEKDLLKLQGAKPIPPLPRLNADVGNAPENDLLNLFQDAPEPVPALPEPVIPDPVPEPKPCPGEGILRRKVTLSNKSYHGVTQEDIDNPKKNLPKYWKPGYFGEYPSNKKLSRRYAPWSTYDHAKFCTNCVMIKKNKQTTVYQCLGH